MFSVYRLTAAETGDFKFCIDNSFSHFSNKIVFFELYVNDETEQNRANIVSSEEAADYEYKLDDFRVISSVLLVYGVFAVSTCLATSNVRVLFCFILEEDNDNIVVRCITDGNIEGGKLAMQQTAMKELL